MTAIEIIIVDDHEVVREGLSALLSGEDVSVVGTAGSSEEAISLVRQQPPDVVLMDVRMPEVDGLVTLETIRQESPELPIVMLSTYDNPTYVARAVALGANDYVLKGDSRETIIEALQRAASGDGSPPTSALRKVQHTMTRSGRDTDGVDLPLTNREVQVLRHVALGLSNKEIGRSLNISVETVKEHIQNILRKLNAADRTDAAVRAVKLGLV